MGNNLKNSFEVRHPFFRPFWRRAAVTCICFGWSMLEFINGATVWASLFGACGLYLFVQFFVRFDPAEYEDKGDPE